MKKLLPTVMALFLVSVSNPIYADWVQFGAAAKCDVKRGIFVLAPVVKTSSEEYDVPASPGYVAFSEKVKQKFMCKLDGLPINLVISVWGASATGMGQGGGVIFIESLSVASQRIFPYRTDFLWNSSNGNGRVLTSIEVRRIKRGYEMQYCYSSGFAWNKKTPFEKMKCGATVEGK